MTNTRLVILPFFIILFHATNAAPTPSSYNGTPIKSLTANMSSRQSQLSIPFSSYLQINSRQRVNYRLKRACHVGRMSQFRTLSGFCNNLKRPTQGAADTPFAVLSTVPVGTPRRFTNILARNSSINARVISNIVCNEVAPKPNKRRMSELITFFGQFLDHTVTETSTVKDEAVQISVTKDDPVFKEAQFIPFFRTLRKGSGRNRAPINALTSYVDGASIYGVGEEDLMKLRTRKGGLLKLPGNLLPRRMDKSGNFAAGDRRVNENPNLIAMNLLWAREHNHIAAEVSTAYPKFNDEEVFQLARHIVSAELQAVTYYSFIPALTGRILPKYRGYKESVRAVITPRFSTVAFRVGHTLLNRTVTAVDATGKSMNIMLRDSFFRPDTFVKHGLDNLFRGMMSGHASEVDSGITGEVRNFLIPSAGSAQQLDLAALNIQRGRDHEVPFCNDLRKSMGLRPFKTMSEIAPGDSNLLRKLNLAYKGDVNVVDPWICGIAEKHVPGSSLGALFDRIIRNELLRLRDGDRFYFEKNGYFKRDQLQKLVSIKKLVNRTPAQLGNIFREIIARNSDIPNHQINRNPFFV